MNPWEWALGWIKLIPLRVWLWLGLILAAMGWHYWDRHQAVMAEEGRWKAKFVAAAQQAAKAKDEYETSSAKRALVYLKALELEKANIKIRTEYIVNEAPNYVPAIADARCVVPRGFVLLHDFAASDQAKISRPPSSDDITDSGIKLSTVATVVGQNYGACHELRDEVKAWRGWYQDQKQLWEKSDVCQLNLGG